MSANGLRGEASAWLGAGSDEQSTDVGELPIAIAVVTRDAAFTIQRVNDAFGRLFGLAHQDVPTVSAWAKRVWD